MPTTALSQSQVRRFFENLRMAVYDKHLERAGYKLVIYVDADVAVRMVAGFEDRAGTEQENLARALISCGFFGPVQILRPHALELYDYISSWAKEEEIEGTAAFWDRVEHFLSESGLKEQLIAIVESANSQGETETPEAKSEYVEKLRVAGVKAFLAFEHALGPWPRRLRRIYGTLLRLDQLGPDIKQLLAENGKMADIAMEALRSIQGPKPYRSIASDYRDACAVAALHWLRRRDERELRQQRVRFYTETNVVRSAMMDPNGLGGHLSYESDYVDAEGIGPEPRRILRSADYFLMRCRFRQLSFEGTESAEELTALIRGVEARDILRLENSQLQGALSELKVEGQTLASIIQEFEDLSLLRGIWAGRVPDAVLTSLPKWKEVIAILKNDRTFSLVSERIDDIEGDLSQHVGRISVWMEDFNRLTRLAKDQRARRAEVFGARGAETAEALLGMRRWGIVLQRAAEAVSVLDRIAEAGSLDSVRACQHVATALERARTKAAEAEYVSAILWGLGDYARIVALLEDLEKMGELKISLKILKYASSLKGDLLAASMESHWWIEWGRIIAELSDGILDAPPESQGTLKIGLAFILFHMSVAGLTRARTSPEAEVMCQRWQMESMALAEAAMAELSEDTIEWALAVNHIAYVAMRTGGAEGQIMDNVIRLRRLERKAISSARIWNARFADTVACYYIWRFKRMKERGEVHILKSDLARARKYLEEARGWNVGDIAVPEHESELEKAELELESLSQAPGAVARA
jgi:hypothetical protein